MNKYKLGATSTRCSGLSPSNFKVRTFSSVHFVAFSFLLAPSSSMNFPGYQIGYHFVWIPLDEQVRGWTTLPMKQRVAGRGWTPLDPMPTAL